MMMPTHSNKFPVFLLSLRLPDFNLQNRLLLARVNKIALLIRALAA